ncbi:MAG: ubiquinol-cytochrome c reductase iron-sulfur subunit [Dehalococcoidia bacterium]
MSHSGAGPDPHDHLDPAPEPEAPRPSRRGFARFLFAIGLGGVVLGAGKLVSDFVTPRKVAPQTRIRVGHVDDVPRGGDPLPLVIDGHLLGYVVHLDPSDTRESGGGGGDGILALGRRCQHLGCTLPWKPDFKFNGEDGWFRCDCHGSTYTRAGIRVFGPAPYSMNTCRVEIDADGNVTVEFEPRLQQRGGPDNPSRAIKGSTRQQRGL